MLLYPEEGLGEQVGLLALVGVAMRKHNSYCCCFALFVQLNPSLAKEFSGWTLVHSPFYCFVLVVAIHPLPWPKILGWHLVSAAVQGNSPFVDLNSPFSWQRDVLFPSQPLSWQRVAG